MTAFMTSRWTRGPIVWIVWSALFITFSSIPSYSYSVLTHEAIIDTAWDPSIVKMLRQKFPNATAEQLKEAHAYAYGGCIIQDMGYYPFGSHLFTNLTHYVRSGAFVVSLLREASSIEEYAFALGALAHYAADNTGHPVAINRSVPLLYSKLREKYGDTVSYAENPTAHVKTEFGFDVLQVARGRYTSDAYRDFIGFKVSKPLLERAFKDTYSMDLKDVFLSLDLAIGTYRKTASVIIPKTTRIAWELKRKEIEEAQPGITSDKFLFQLAPGKYEQTWGREYKKPGISSRLLSFVIRVMPRIGPFKATAFKTPTPETEKLFLESFKATVDRYRELLAALEKAQLKLQDRNFDLGEPTQPGMYKIADDAYATLIDHLAGHHFEGVLPVVRDDILAFYSHADAPISTKQHAHQWEKLLGQLEELRSAQGKAIPTVRKN
jgi:hypothetical protein